VVAYPERRRLKPGCNVGTNRRTKGGTLAKKETKRGRDVPRPFEFHWGGGQIIEEAAYTGQYTEPAIQLLEYEGHPGSYGIRFCYYNLDGRFQRSPMMIDSEDSLEGLRAALKETPKLRALLQKLVT
jgi:hypothetical protein